MELLHASMPLACWNFPLFFSLLGWKTPAWYLIKIFPDPLSNKLLLFYSEANMHHGELITEFISLERSSFVSHSTLYPGALLRPRSEYKLWIQADVLKISSWVSSNLSQCRKRIYVHVCVLVLCKCEHGIQWLCTHAFTCTDNLIKLFVLICYRLTY